MPAPTVPADPPARADAAACGRPALTPETPIAALPFRLGTLNRLRTAGVPTVEALCRMRTDELAAIERLGPAGAREVEDVLAAPGLALGAGSDGGETPVAALAMSARTAGALRAAGVHTVETLCLLTPVELSRVRQLGLEGALEIHAALGDGGFTLRSGGDVPDTDKAKAFVRALGRADEDDDRVPFPTPADVEAVLNAAAHEGVAHTAAGERLRYVARRLGALVPRGRGRGAR